MKANSRFIGLENYTKMFQTAAFKKALVNTGYYALFSVILIMVIALLLAVWLSGKQDRFHSFIQGSVFLPHVISMVSIGLIFQQMMDPDFGVFNQVLTALHLPACTWLRSSSTAVALLSLQMSWKSVGYYTLILLAAIQGFRPAFTRQPVLTMPESYVFFQNYASNDLTADILYADRADHWQL